MGGHLREERTASGPGPFQPMSEHQGEGPAGGTQRPHFLGECLEPQVREPPIHRMGLWDSEKWMECEAALTFSEFCSCGEPERPEPEQVAWRGQEGK